MSRAITSMRMRHLLLLPALLLASKLFSSCFGFFGGGLPPLPKATGFAAFPGPSLLVDAAYVHQRMNQPDVKIIDVRSQDEYTSGHLIGAINIPARIWRTPTAQAQIFHEDGDALKPFDPQRYERFLGDRGIGSDDEVIIYGSPRFQPETLAPAMIMDWLGHRQLHFFDGEATTVWRRAGMPLDRQRLGFGQLTEYRAKPRPKALWTMRQILEVLARPDKGEIVFWDCRSREEYEGSVRLRDVERAGHLPRAVHLDYMDLYLDSALFQTRGYSELKISMDKVGLTPDKQIVIYCHNGSRAAYAYLVLRAMAFPRVAVYDHSWAEWGNGDAPIAKLSDKEPEVRTIPPRKQLQNDTMIFSNTRTVRR